MVKDQKAKEMQKEKVKQKMQKKILPSASTVSVT